MEVSPLFPCLVLSQNHVRDTRMKFHTTLLFKIWICCFSFVVVRSFLSSEDHWRKHSANHMSSKLLQLCLQNDVIRCLNDARHKLTTYRTVGVVDDRPFSSSASGRTWHVPAPQCDPGSVFCWSQSSVRLKVDVDEADVSTQYCAELSALDPASAKPRRSLMCSGGAQTAPCNSSSSPSKIDVGGPPNASPLRLAAACGPLGLQRCARACMRGPRQCLFKHLSDAEPR